MTAGPRELRVQRRACLLTPSPAAGGPGPEFWLSIGHWWGAPCLASETWVSILPRSLFPTPRKLADVQGAAVKQSIRTRLRAGREPLPEKGLLGGPEPLSQKRNMGHPLPWLVIASPIGRMIRWPRSEVLGRRRPCFSLTSIRRPQLRVPHVSRLRRGSPCRHDLLFLAYEQALNPLAGPLPMSQKRDMGHPLPWLVMEPPYAC
jgi:hypothetical protein